MSIDITVPEVSELKVDLMRGAFGFAVLLTFESLRQLRHRGDRARPVGIARLFDIGRIERHRMRLHRLGIAAMLAYVVDVGAVWALAVLSVVLLLEVTLVNSDGPVSHGFHLPLLVSLAQLAAFVTWNAADRFDWDLGEWLAGTRDDTAAWWALQGIVAAYFTSGVTKVIRTAGAWVLASPGHLLSAAAKLEIAYAMGGPRQRATIARSQAVVDTLIPRPWVARAVMGGGLVVELLAPLAVLGAAAAIPIGFGLVLLHQANGLMFRLPFWNWQVIVLAFVVLPGIGS